MPRMPHRFISRGKTSRMIQFETQSLHFKQHFCEQYTNFATSIRGIWENYLPSCYWRLPQPCKHKQIGPAHGPLLPNSQDPATCLKPAWHQLRWGKSSKWVWRWAIIVAFVQRIQQRTRWNQIHLYRWCQRFVRHRCKNGHLRALQQAEERGHSCWRNCRIRHHSL